MEINEFYIYLGILSIEVLLVVISLMECLGEIQQLTTGLKSMVL
jgi:hypothetical protein